MTSVSPIAAACSLLAVTAAATLAVRRRADWIRLAVLVPCATAYTASLPPLVGSLAAPRFPADPGASLYVAQSLYAAWWLLLARVAVAAGKLLLGINRRPKAMHLASDFVAGAVYLVAALAILDLVFGISVTGLVATSGIIAIVLGLALQNTLGDLFSGMAIGIDRAFGVGDVISIDGVADGRVIEASWRSVRLATVAGALATVPNSVVAKSRLLNRTTPRDLQNAAVRVVVDPAAPHEAVAAAMRAAFFTAFPRDVDAVPAVTCTDLKGEGTTFQLGFSAPLGEFDGARSTLLTEVSRHLRHAGLALAPQDGSPLLRTPPPTIEERLRRVPLFGGLAAEEIAVLMSGVVEHEGEAGAAMFTQGGDLASLFVVARGAFAVERDDGEGPRRLATIGPGAHFGELALLTGVSNPATVRALTPFHSLEIGKAVVAPLLERNRDLLDAFEAAAAKAGDLLERTIAGAASWAAPDLPLVLRIADFFDLKVGAFRRDAAHAGRSGKTTGARRR